MNRLAILRSWTAWAILSAPVAPTLNAEPEAPNWRCQESQWVGEPQLEDGLFESELAMKCTLALPTEVSIKTIGAAIEHEVEERQVHARTVGANGKISFDTTLQTGDESGQLKIREAVTLQKKKDAIEYETESKEITAPGLAGYLKFVAFSAVIKPLPKSSEYEVQLTNSIAVERPWFALAPLFYVICKGQAKDKFNLARNRLFARLSDL